MLVLIFFFNDTATTEIYTLSLHDALPILALREGARLADHRRGADGDGQVAMRDGAGAQGHGLVEHDGARACIDQDRKSTRLNSSHSQISYAVFCLKKKKKNEKV